MTREPEWSVATAADPAALIGSTKLMALFDRLECIVEEAVPALVDEELFPDERSHIANAVPKRRAEFGTARVCARRALSRLGIAPMSLVPFGDRAPRWPDGVVGSISHTHGYCAVVVAKAAQVRSIGLDVEQDKPLASGLIDRICTAREREYLRHTSERDAIVYFSAKEALYKCQYPLTTTYLDFHDVELDVDFERGTFVGHLVKRLEPHPQWGSELRGAFIRERGLVLSGMALTVAPQD